MKTTIILAMQFFFFLSAVAEYDPNWWKSLVLVPAPTNDYVHAAAVLRQQEDTVVFLWGADYPAADAVAATNLWNMLATLHGDLREKKIENPPPVFRNFGIITNQVELQRRIAVNEEAKKVRFYESLRRALEERIDQVFMNAASSEALASFSVQDRNAIVSNLVETARFTPDEAAAIGLTNVVEFVGE